VRVARYNEVLFAVIGTIVLLGGVALGAFALVGLLGGRPPPGLVVDAPGSKRPKQTLVACLGRTDPAGAFQYIPVGLVVASEADRDPVLAVRKYARSFGDCDVFGRGDASRIVNAVVRDLETGDQKLALTEPGQVASLAVPESKCSEGEGDTPCDALLWELRTQDTNGDGRIDRNDALAAYVSGLSAGDLRRLTPANATVLRSRWIPKAGKWQFQVRADANGDGRFSEEDGSELLEADAVPTATEAKPVIDATIRESLNEALR